MTQDNAVETVHVANSLLAELAKYTTVDIDNNVASIAVQHNLAYRRMLELAQETGEASSSADVQRQQQQQVLAEFRSLFNDMTSNQIIVLWTISSRLETDPARAEKLLLNALSLAKQLYAGTFEGKPLDKVMQQRLSVAQGGLSGSETDAELVQQLASDVLTATVGLEMLPHLLSVGNLHAQTLPSQAYNLRATVRHARRFVALYELVSGGQVDGSRVSIKIPSTIPGIQAMRYLSSGGKLDESNLGETMPEGPIKVLGTAVFAVEQGLGAAQAGGASFISPYINALAAHFFAVENPTGEARDIPVAAGKRSVDEIIFPLQRLLLRLAKDGESVTGKPTLMKAASFLDPDEALSLCGMDQVTLGAPIVDALAKMPVSQQGLAIMQRARDQIAPATDEEMQRYGAVQAKLDAQETGYGGWLAQGSPSYVRLEKALTQDDRVRYMLNDALTRFEGAEKQLRKLFEERMA
ncbi:aldolase [Testicularia cyperi]|uniref:Transaldolase n=1 Tax=Testicularia cyperi TaxID=1882483 RepID=A0A317XXN3_9BASI|nr:aldolase [Testicularia cyperi]